MLPGTFVVRRARVAASLEDSSDHARANLIRRRQPGEAKESKGRCGGEKRIPTLLGFLSR